MHYLEVPGPLQWINSIKNNQIPVMFGSAIKYLWSEFKKLMAMKETIPKDRRNAKLFLAKVAAAWSTRGIVVTDEDTHYYSSSSATARMRQFIVYQTMLIHSITM